MQIESTMFNANLGGHGSKVTEVIGFLCHFFSNSKKVCHSFELPCVQMGSAMIFINNASFTGQRS